MDEKKHFKNTFIFKILKIGEQATKKKLRREPRDRNPSLTLSDGKRKEKKEGSEGGRKTEQKGLGLWYAYKEA